VIDIAASGVHAPVIQALRMRATDLASGVCAHDIQDYQVRANDSPASEICAPAIQAFRLRAIDILTFGVRTENIQAFLVCATNISASGLRACARGPAAPMQMSCMRFKNISTNGLFTTFNLVKLRLSRKRSCQGRAALKVHDQIRMVNRREMSTRSHRAVKLRTFMVKYKSASAETLSASFSTGKSRTLKVTTKLATSTSTPRPLSAPSTVPVMSLFGAALPWFVLISLARSWSRIRKIDLRWLVWLFRAQAVDATAQDVANYSSEESQN
jgi:hypothetical protein